MNSKTMTAILAAASVALPAASFAAVPEVTSVTMTQATSSRLVTIEYTLEDAPAVITLDVQTNANTSATAEDPGWTSIGGEGVSNAKGDVWKKVAPGLTEGNSFNGTITWRPDLSWPDHNIADGGARAVVTAWSLDNTPDYMVVDISEGAQQNTQKYYPGVDFLPGSQPGQKGAITNNPIYKTTTLVMRKIMAKDVTWTMGSTSLETKRRAAREATHQVTLTNNYYIGVFEVTQAQWASIKGDYPSYFNNVEYRATRPVEMVGYGNSRTANDSTCNWPAPPHADSFLGKLRSRTGIDFDLPGEAQWEFAARAGNGDTKWGDGSGIKNTNTDANLNLIGRYAMNGGYIDGSTRPGQDCGPENATAIVGSYAPNDWGLYDTAGNVYELCLDWFEDDITTYGGNVNVNLEAPLNTLSGNPGAQRVYKGGAWHHEDDTIGSAGVCRPAYRFYPPSGTGNHKGLRVVCTAGLR